MVRVEVPCLGQDGDGLRVTTRPLVQLRDRQAAVDELGTVSLLRVDALQAHVRFEVHREPAQDHQEGLDPLVQQAVLHEHLGFRQVLAEEVLLLARQRAVDSGRPGGRGLGNGFDVPDDGVSGCLAEGAGAPQLLRETRHFLGGTKRPGHLQPLDGFLRILEPAGPDQIAPGSEQQRLRARDTPGAGVETSQHHSGYGLFRTVSQGALHQLFGLFGVSRQLECLYERLEGGEFLGMLLAQRPGNRDRAPGITQARQAARRVGERSQLHVS